MEKYAVGVDIGGTRTKIGLVNLDKGKVLSMEVSPTEKQDAKKFINTVCCQVKKLVGLVPGGASKVEGIGFGVSGFVTADGVVDSTYGFLEFMEDYPLVQIAENELSLHCIADNDARVVALGEAVYGNPDACRRVLVLTLGTGLGVGFCIDRAFADLQPYGHMAGHISVGGTSSICYCGRAGCLESAVSATSLHQAVLQHNSSGLLPIVPATARQVFTAASRGHKKAQAILQDFLTALQCGIDTYINLLAPDLIIIGGGLSSSLGGYLESLKSEKLLRPFKNYRVRLELSSLRERAGILGAAALFINKI